LSRRGDFSKDVSHCPEANAELLCDGFLVVALRVMRGNPTVQENRAGVIIQPMTLEIATGGLLAHRYPSI
jgi:hypothetical protein